MLSQKNVRLQRELALFADSPPHGISCWTKEGSLQHLEARKSRRKREIGLLERNPTRTKP